LIRKAIRLVFSLIGLIIGFTSYSTLAKSFEILTFGSELYGLIAAIIFGIIIAILGYLIEPWASKKTKDVAKVLDKELSKYPQVDILLASIGIIGGFVVAYLISGIFDKIPVVGGVISLLLYLCL
jgi:uncharacterized protein YacL